MRYNLIHNFRNMTSPLNLHYLFCVRVRWKCTIIYLVVVILLASNVAEAAIGVNWGRHTSQRLLPSQVVDLLLQNEVKEARVYTSQDDILKAFSGSGIKLTVTIFSLSSIETEQQAKDWVTMRTPYFTSANVWRVNVANMGYDMQKKLTDVDTIFRPYEMMQSAINQAQLGAKIKLTIQYDTTAVLKDNIVRPSEAEFRDEAMPQMLKSVKILQENNAPFVIETFLISRITSRKWDIDFAFFDGRSPRVIKDVNGAVYTNMFEFEYDCILWALEKIGASDLNVVVGQVGWATDGFIAANISMAERFYKGFLPYVASNKGTPKRPGVPVDVYVHALTDENKLAFSSPHARHWGIYRTNGEPKYKIDLTGQGRDIFPSKLVGINRMPDRWCVFNDEQYAPDDDRVKNIVVQACQSADCTSTWPGGSCGNVTAKQNVSYIFNTFFQSMYQDVKACLFNGLGKVVYRDPSTGTCVFPVEVVKGVQDQFVPVSQLMNAGNRIRDISSVRSFTILILFKVFIL